MADRKLLARNNFIFLVVPTHSEPALWTAMLSELKCVRVRSSMWPVCVLFSQESDVKGPELLVNLEPRTDSAP